MPDTEGKINIKLQMTEHVKLCEELRQSGRFFGYPRLVYDALKAFKLQRSRKDT